MQKTSPEAHSKLETALSLFQKEMLTLSQAARFSGLHVSQFQKELGKRKIPVHYDEAMLENDIATLNKLFDDSRK